MQKRKTVLNALSNGNIATKEEVKDIKTIVPINDIQGNVEFKDVWNSIIKTELRKKLSQNYIGETYCYGRQGTPEANCIYFDTKDKDKYIYQTEGLSFIPNDLSRIISINGPFDYWNKKPVDHYPYNNPKYTKYSFRPTGCSPQIVEVLRQKGNLVFYEE